MRTNTVRILTSRSRGSKEYLEIKIKIQNNLDLNLNVEWALQSAIQTLQNVWTILSPNIKRLHYIDNFNSSLLLLHVLDFQIH